MKVKELTGENLTGLKCAGCGRAFEINRFGAKKWHIPDVCECTRCGEALHVECSFDLGDPLAHVTCAKCVLPGEHLEPCRKTSAGYSSR